MIASDLVQEIGKIILEYLIISEKKNLFQTTEFVSKVLGSNLKSPPTRQRWESLIFRKNNNFKEIMHIKYLIIHEFKMILNRKTITGHCCLMLRNKFTALKLEKNLTFVLFFLYELY